MAAANTSRRRGVVILHRGSTCGRLVRGYLNVEGHRVGEAESVTETIGRIADGSASVVVVDVSAQWPPAAAYRQLLMTAHQHSLPVIALVPHGAGPNEHSLTHLVKPFSLADLGEKVASASPADPSRAALRGQPRRAAAGTRTPEPVLQD